MADKKQIIFGVEFTNQDGEVKRCVDPRPFGEIVRAFINYCNEKKEDEKGEKKD